MQQRHLLSVLSHVVHGYVGNRSTVFPLQMAGWDVDVINTTNYSNHPGYGQFKGSATDASQVTALFEGLARIVDINETYSVIVVGYCPSAEIMSAAYDSLKAAFGSGKKPHLVVDPVLGDNGRLYVAEEIVPLHKDFLQLGLVDLTTPNQFELELLTGVKLTGWAAVQDAFSVFWERYKVPNVVLSSVMIDGAMHCVGFCRESSPQLFSVEVELIDCTFNGCGDVFTALLTNAYFNNGCKVSPEVLAATLGALHKVLLASYEAEHKVNPSPKVVRNLRLVQLREHFFAPAASVRYSALE